MAAAKKRGVRYAQPQDIAFNQMRQAMPDVGHVDETVERFARERCVHLDSFDVFELLDWVQ